MEEAAFLPAVERDVGIVEIEHDLAWRTLMRSQEKLDEQRIDLRPVAVDLVILRAMALRRVLQAIERALARQRFAVRPQHRVQLPRQHRKRPVLAQLVVIVEVLVAQHQAEDPLPHQRLDPVLDVARIAPVGEALGEPTHQSETAVHLPQQQRTRIRGDVAAIETGHHRTSLNRVCGGLQPSTVPRWNRRVDRASGRSWRPAGTAGLGRVGMWRGGGRPGMSVAAPFV